MSFESTTVFLLTQLQSEWPKLYTILAFLSATGIMSKIKFFKMHALPSDEQFDHNGEKKV